MSIFSDLYISTSDQADQYNTQNPFADNERIRCSDITIVELSLLWTLVEKREWNPDQLKEFACVSRRKDGECSIHRLPERLIEALATIHPDKVRAIAVNWAEAPEIASPASAMEPLIRTLIELAVRALATRRELFIWNQVHT